MSSKHYNKWEFLQALSVIKTDPFEAKIRYEEYLKKYPKDYSAYSYYASTLITLGEFYEAEKVLNFAEMVFNNHEQNLSEFNKVKKYVINRLRLLSYQEKYEELYKLCLKYYQEILDMNMGNIIFYARKKTDQLNQDMRERNSYLFRQITEYQEQDFLERVQKYLPEYNQNIENPNTTLFASDFPFNKIIEEVKKQIISDKRIFPNFYEDVYIFKYDNCGKDNNKPVDYFKVVCFHNTKDIIIMLPTANYQNLPCCIDLNYLIQDTKQDYKVRRLSQTEKFNQRYGRL